MNLLAGLNEQQLQAVTSESPVILCLAGAGSGKTRVLTHRAAYLHQEKRVGTSNMLALTFTRLAAKEIKERAMTLVGEREGKKLTVGTFHSFCVQVLRRWGHLVGLEPNFTIYDEEDREALIKAAIGELGYKKVKLQEVLTNLQDPPEETQVAKVIQEYLYRLARNNAVDLDGLLTATYDVLSFPDALSDLQNRYQYVFVDEFQDTNDVQFGIIRRLAPGQMFVVGDDYQALYSWRGANVRNIIEFPEKYPGCEVVKLERNYRSTRPIVSAANCLIAHNQQQTEKTLITERAGMPIVYSTYPDEEAEARAVAARIVYEAGTTPNWSDYAVLARTNRQVQKVKEICNSCGIPALVVSNQDDIFKKQDIRCLFAFLELTTNRYDDINFRKVVNFPHPRLSPLELQNVEYSALMAGQSFFEAFMGLVSTYEQPKHNRAIVEFDGILTSLQDILEKYDSASEILSQAALVTGLRDYYLANGLQNRIEDLAELLKQVERWQAVQESLGESTGIGAFLKWLRTKDIQERLVQEQADAVKLMTVHAAKGLEFPVVFVIGLNQNTFPSHRAEDPEEERRLFYVAITRAKDRLYLSRPEQRAVYPGGPMVLQFESQFIREMNG